MVKLHVTGSWYAQEDNASLMEHLVSLGHTVYDWTSKAHTSLSKKDQFLAIRAAILEADVCFFSLENMVHKDGPNKGEERETAASYLQFGVALGAQKPCIVYDPRKTTRPTEEHRPLPFTNLMGWALHSLPGTVLWTDNMDEALTEIPKLKWTVELPVPPADARPNIHVTGSWFAQPENATLIDHFSKYHTLCNWTTKEHQDKPKEEQLLAILSAIHHADACFFSLDGMVKDGRERTTAATYIQFGVALGALKQIVVFDPLKTTRPTTKECRPRCPPALNNNMGEALYNLPEQVVWTANFVEAEQLLDKFLLTA